MKDWANDINFRRKIAEENRRMDEAERKLTPLFWAACILAVVVISYSPTSKAADATLMINIIECESSGRYNAVGYDGVSVGIAQFQKSTFDEMKAKARMPNLRWKNPIHQLRLMVWMLDHGHGNRWTCFRKLKSGEK